MKKFLSGNEAIALGAHEAGVLVVAAYPGTPSTEILESIVQYPEIDCQWSPNEKVALDVASGAAFCGARALAAMKHVGLNVASDSLMTLSYTGSKGGLVIVTCDDPGMHSSQNEQDNHHYAAFAKVPMLDPADSQEAKDFTVFAFKLSEKFDTPVLLRSTTRISHGKGVVKTGRMAKLRRSYSFDADRQKYVMIPAYARVRHALVEKRLGKLKEFSDETELNRIEWGDKGIGIIAAGVSYYYAKEVAPDASFLKLGMSYPLPEKKVRRFARQVKKLYVIEELDDFIAEQIRAMGIEVRSKAPAFRLGELDPLKVKAILRGANEVPEPAETGRPHPPAMCPGCGHRGIFWSLKRLGLKVTGDIGCYTLGTLPPLEALHTCVCMGAGIGHAHGISKAVSPEEAKKTVAVIGDSTFFHAGIGPLMDAVYNKGNVTVVILDNRTTAMTGRQDHPGTGKTLRGEPTNEIDIPKLCRALGVEDVKTVDPFDLGGVSAALRDSLSREGVSVLVSCAECLLISRKREQAVMFHVEHCRECGLCLLLGCPAIEEVKGQPRIISELCTGCGICVQVCKFGALTPYDAES